MGELDRDVAVVEVRSVREAVAAALRHPVLRALVLSGFGTIALLLATLGVDGVVSEAVVARTREMGIRLALGARRSQVIWLVVRRGLLLTAIGVALGLLVAFVAGRALTALLYGVEPTAPRVTAVVSVLFVVLAALASYLPARRAARVSPVQALRTE